MPPTRRPNVLIVMTDQERHPPPYEQEALAEFRRTHLPARQRILDAGLQLHRHYVASTACLPSRASLFTGQYPTLHGVTNTDGLAKSADDDVMRWLDPAGVPTMGDWFRAAGYRTHYRGKWHISHADLLAPGTHRPLAVNDREGNVDRDAVEAYRRADPLDPFGFSGWIGPEPHGADPANTGFVRDPLYVEQVEALFDELAAGGDGGGDRRPWLAVASLVNPHDIAFSGAGWQLLDFPPTPDWIPEVPAPPSQSDSLADRPTAQQQFVEVWHRVLYVQPADEAYRRFYHWLHVLVDECIGQILDALERSGMADDTIVVFTSDHGDLLGAHGGLQQKWHNAYDEALRVPFVLYGPGVDTAGAGDGSGLAVPTSHVDVLPTLLGLAGVDVEAAAAALARDHTEVHPFAGRDLSTVVGGAVPAGFGTDPVYFMTEDQISRGPRHVNRFTGEPYEPVGAPGKVEAVVASLPTGPGGSPELWKLAHYYDRLPDGLEATPPVGDVEVEPQWELHNLTVDPEERTNRAGTDAAVADQLRRVLEEQRAAKRRRPRAAATA